MYQQDFMSVGYISVSGCRSLLRQQFHAAMVTLIATELLLHLGTERLASDDMWQNQIDSI